MADDFGERDLIENILAPLSKDCKGALSLSDDAAYLTPRPGFDLVITQDSLVAGVHFFADDKPEDIAMKALRVNLSDLCAKGASARSYLLSLFMTEEIGPAWIKRFATGLEAGQQTYDICLLGGDTVSTPGPFSLTVTMLGEVEGRMLTRLGAKPGDLIFVTGTIGDAALGLELLIDKTRPTDSKDSKFLIQRYAIPEPRCGMINALSHANAAMDISDGLAGDLGLLCAASKVTATVNIPDIPLSPAARNMLNENPARLQTILGGGDDYEILCTVQKDKAAAFEKDADVPVKCIGRIEQGSAAPLFLGKDGKTIIIGNPSYRHF